MSSQNSTQNSHTPGAEDTTTSGDDGSQFPNLSQLPSVAQFSDGSFYRSGSAFTNWNPFATQNSGPPGHPAQSGYHPGGSHFQPGSQVPPPYHVPYGGNATYVGPGIPLTPEASQNYYQWSIGRGIDPNYGDHVYRPQVITPHPHPSYGPGPDMNAPVFDPRFGTSAYEVHDMMPSSQKGKSKSTRSKAASTPAGTEAAPSTTRAPRVIYTPLETKTLAEVWIDISEDGVVANNQRREGLWIRIARRYNRIRPEGSPQHSHGELRKHFERTMLEMSKFDGYFRNLVNNMKSGETEDDCRNAATLWFTEHVNKQGFKHWLAYSSLKHIPKFQIGLEAAKAKAQGRTRLTELSGRSTSSGADHTDTGSGSQEVSGPPTRRPIGRTKEKALRAKGKGKAPAQTSETPGQLTPDQTLAAFNTLGRFMKMKKHADTEEEKRDIERTIKMLRQKLGLDEEAADGNDEDEDDD